MRPLHPRRPQLLPLLSLALLTLAQLITPGTAAAQELAATATPYGLAALWAEGDGVAHATLVILGLMSVASWYVMLAKLVVQQRLLRQTRAAARVLARPEQAAEPTLASLPPHHPLRALAAAAVAADRCHQEGHVHQVDRLTWLALALQGGITQATRGLPGGLTLLATVAATAPFVGLFGTVWGIHHALITIGISGQATIDRVAGPVGEALIMTALGLVVAVPAVIGHNALVRRNKVASEAVRAVAGELQTRLLSGGRLAPSTSRAAA